jgi:hypothetical protein
MKGIKMFTNLLDSEWSGLPQGTEEHNGFFLIPIKETENNITTTLYAICVWSEIRQSYVCLKNDALPLEDARWEVTAR